MAGRMLLVKYAGKENTESDNLYVSGLPSPQVSESTLQELFASLGLTVTRAKIIPDTRGTGSSAAMVQVANVDEAATAIVGLNGQPCPAEVQPGGAAPSSAGFGASSAGFGGSVWAKYAGKDGSPSDNLYVAGLPSPQVSQSMLAQFFGSMGFTVARSKPIPDTMGLGSSAAMVQLASQEQAAQAIEALKAASASGAGMKRPAQSTAPSGPLKMKYAGSDNAPSDNVYIAGLPSPSVDGGALTSLFQELGFTVVRSKVIPDTRGAGSSAALVQLASQEEAASAIIALDGQPPPEGLVGAFVQQPAAKRPRLMAPARGGGAAGVRALGPGVWAKYAGKDSAPSDNLYLAGLRSPAVDPMELEVVFSSLGLSIVRSRIIPDTAGIGTSAAMVQVSSPQEAASAIEAFSAGAAASPMAMGQKGASLVGGKGAPPGAGGATLSLKYAGKDNAPSDNLYIHGLPSPQVSTDVLSQVFAACGLTVMRCKAIPDTRGQGCSAAMVQVASPEEAAAAISALSSQTWSAIVATSQAAPAAGGSSFIKATFGTNVWAKYSGKDGAPSDNLYIAGLPSPAVDPQAVEGAFAGLGLTVVRSRVIPDTRGTGSSAAMVQFASPEQAAQAMADCNSELAPQVKGCGCGGKGKGAPGMKGGAPAFKGWGGGKVGGGKVGGGGKDMGGLAMVVKYSGRDGAPSDNLYVSGLPSPQVSENDLLLKFQELGLTVVRTKIIPDSWGNGRSGAMVQVGSPAEAALAIEQLNGQLWV